jgi:hypothetical protein
VRWWAVDDVPEGVTELIGRVDSVIGGCSRGDRGFQPTVSQLDDVTAGVRRCDREGHPT